MVSGILVADQLKLFILFHKTGRPPERRLFPFVGVYIDQVTNFCLMWCSAFSECKSETSLHVTWRGRGSYNIPELYQLLKLWCYNCFDVECDRWLEDTHFTFQDNMYAN